MARWFLATLYNNEIKPVEVVKESGQRITVLESGQQRVHHKITEGEGYFPAWPLAKCWLMGRHRIAVSEALRNLEWKQNKLAAAQALPDEEA